MPKQQNEKLTLAETLKNLCAINPKKFAALSADETDLLRACTNEAIDQLRSLNGCINFDQTLMRFFGTTYLMGRHVSEVHQKIPAKRKYKKRRVKKS